MIAMWIIIGVVVLLLLAGAAFYDRRARRRGLRMRSGADMSARARELRRDSLAQNADERDTAGGWGGWGGMSG